MSEPIDPTELLAKMEVKNLAQETPIILEGQYREAYDAMLDASQAGLYVGLIGPVGSGKTALCRRFAEDLERPFEWVTAAGSASRFPRRPACSAACPLRC